MRNTDTFIRRLRKQVCQDAQNSAFRHSEWFVEYHLEIVEKLASELCEIYSDADPDHVQTLVWAHDYEKIIDFDNQHNEELQATKDLLAKCGYGKDQISRICEDIRILNRKDDIALQSIEVQIVSSADGASHLIGPFQAIYWQENSQLSISELQKETLRKIKVDWDKKITLPEARETVASRYDAIYEWVELPQRVLPVHAVPKTKHNV